MDLATRLREEGISPQRLRSNGPLAINYRWEQRRQHGEIGFLELLGSKFYIRTLRCPRIRDETVLRDILRSQARALVEYVFKDQVPLFDVETYILKGETQQKQIDP